MLSRDAVPLGTGDLHALAVPEPSQALSNLRSPEIHLQQFRVSGSGVTAVTDQPTNKEQQKPMPLLCGNTHVQELG